MQYGIRSVAGLGVIPSCYYVHYSSCRKEKEMSEFVDIVQTVSFVILCMAFVIHMREVHK